LFPGAGALVLGSFFSNFARSEFQVVQFIPLTYVAHALREVMLKGAGVADILHPDLLALGLFFLISFPGQRFFTNV
jgi:ABC-2 type transport system permease protein